MGQREPGAVLACDWCEKRGAMSGTERASMTAEGNTEDKTTRRGPLSAKRWKKSRKAWSTAKHTKASAACLGWRRETQQHRHMPSGTQPTSTLALHLFSMASGWGSEASPRWPLARAQASPTDTTSTLLSPATDRQQPNVERTSSPPLT